MSTKWFNHDPNRGNWHVHVEFWLACIGNAIGIRTFGLFSYYLEAGGCVAVLIPFIILLYIITSPMFFTEAFMGQFSSTGFISVFRVSMFCKGLGFVMLVLNSASLIYFGVVTAYPLAMIHRLVHYKTPWSIIDMSGITKPHHIGIYSNKTAPELYFLTQAKRLESGWNDKSLANPIMIAVPIIWLLVALCLIKGVRSVGKVVYVTVAVPFILLIIIFIRSFFAFGNVPGITFFSRHNDWSKLGNWETYMAAVILAAYLLGQGWGILIVLGSYNRFRQPLNKITANLPHVCLILAALGGAWTEVIANYLKDLGISSEKVIANQFNLAFMLLPDFTAYTNTSQGWAWMFYLMLFLLEFHSILIQTFAVVTTLFDEFAKLRNYKMHVTGAFCLVFAVIGIIYGSYGIYPPIDKLVLYAVLAHLLIYFLIIIVSWVNIRRIKGDIAFTFTASRDLCQYVIGFTAILLLITFIWLAVTGMPFLAIQPSAWPMELSITFVALSFLCFPGYIVYKFLFKANEPFTDAIRKSLQPYKWHPVDECDRTTYLSSTESSIMSPIGAVVPEE